MKQIKEIVHSNNLYQIAEITPNSFNAGPKAVHDVISIANRVGFKLLPVSVKFPGTSLKNRISRQLLFEREWANINNAVKNNSIILLQHPFRTRQLTRERTLFKLKKDRNVKYICFIHDIEPLRLKGQHLGTYHEKYFEREYKFMLNIADILIVHNDMMKQYIMNSTTFCPKRIVSLSIFDYLKDSNVKTCPIYEKSINIAGNLDLQHHGYLNQLSKIDCQFYLFGPHYSNNSMRNIHYRGIIAPDKLPSILDRGFGLIWDGNSIDTCSGPEGKYLQYNNPHKLSLYIAAGIPVIIWTKAAEAKFVSDNQIGFSINSLNELPHLLKNMDKDTYYKMVKNVSNISDKVCRGFYTESALNTAKELIFH